MNGAEIILVPTVTSENLGDGFPETDHPDGKIMEVIEFMQKANAMCNGVFVGWCNRVGTEEGNMVMTGQSMVIDPYGRILAKANNKTTEVLVADVDFNKIRQIRKGMHLMSDRRPDSYKGILKMYGSEPYYDDKRVTGRKPF